MNIGKIALISLAAAMICAAQDKVTVPLSNPSQPVTIKANMLNGSITVTAGTGSEVVINTSDPDGKQRNRRDDAPSGMKRINGRAGLNIEEDHNVITIRGTSGENDGNIVIQTPVNTNLQLKTTNGRSIEVTGVNGDHEIESTNGTIKLTNISGSVVAHALNGDVTASLDRITAGKPMSFTSLNGKIDVTLPNDAKARLRLKSDNGSIYSDFDVKLESDAAKPVVTDSRSEGGKYKIQVDRSVTGTINGGGPEYTFQTMNGNILIHKK